MASAATVDCGVCGRAVPRASVVVHEAQCIRHFYTCDDCGEMVRRVDRTEHDAVLCRERRLVTCQFCSIEVRARDAPVHEEWCGARTDVCLNCATYVILRDWREHVLQCTQVAAGGAPPPPPPKPDADESEEKDQFPAEPDAEAVAALPAAARLALEAAARPRGPFCVEAEAESPLPTALSFSRDDAEALAGALLQAPCGSRFRGVTRLALRGCGLGDGEAAVLADHLPALRLTRICLAHNKLTPIGARHVLRALAAATRPVEFLSLARNALSWRPGAPGERPWAELGAARLLGLDVTASGVGDDDVRAMAAAGSLRELVLGQLRLSGAAVAAAAGAAGLRRLALPGTGLGLGRQSALPAILGHALRELDLSATRLQTRELDALWAALDSGGNTVAALDLSGNQLAGDDLAWVANLLVRRDRALRKAAVEGCGLTAADVAVAAEAGVEAAGGEDGAGQDLELSLADNNVGGECLAAVLALVTGAAPAAWRELRLDGVQMQPPAEAAAALAAALPQLPALQRLSVSNNNLGAAGVGALAPALAALREVDLRGNSAGHAGAAAVAQAVDAQGSALRAVALERNHVGIGIGALRTALRDNHRLEWLSLSRADVEWAMPSAAHTRRLLRPKVVRHRPWPLPCKIAFLGALFARHGVDVLPEDVLRDILGMLREPVRRHVVLR